MGFGFLMLKWILPRETCFFDFFEKQMEIILASTRLFSELVNARESNPGKALEIRDLEHQADEVTHQCIEELHKTFITPFERNQIHQLITQMDDIIDSIEETATRIHIYEIQVMTPEVKVLAQILVKAVLEVQTAIGQLRQLKKTPILSEAIVNVHFLENEADTTLRDSLARLFKEQSDVRDLIKWKEIYENLENAIDSCEDVVNIIEGVILEMA